MRLSRTASIAALFLVLAACSGPAPTNAPTGPAASATPGASAGPTPGATATLTAAPTSTAAGEPTAAHITAWATQVCDINADYVAASQQITTDLPEPADRSLDALQEINAQRQPRVAQSMSDALARLDEVMPWLGGEAFRQALVAELQTQLDTLPDLYQQIADATSVEEIDAAFAARLTVTTGGLLGSARAVQDIDLPFADGLAAITTGCRFYEADARARPHGRATADFSQVVIDETFDATGQWDTAPFEGGTTSISDGGLTIAFDRAFVSQVANTAGHPQAEFHDARIETHVSLEGSLLAGLSCRESATNRYTVLINQLGLVLIIRSSGNLVLGRRAPPEGFDMSAGVDMAIECVAGNLDPLVLVVYLNGERVAEVEEATALDSEGLAGLTAQSFAADSSATFDNFRVLVPAE